MTRPQLLLERARGWRPRVPRPFFWFALQMLFLAIQWWTWRGAPLAFHKANGSGWRCFCIGVKDP